MRLSHHSPRTLQQKWGALPLGPGLVAHHGSPFLVATVIPHCWTAARHALYDDCDVDEGGAGDGDGADGSAIDGGDDAGSGADGMVMVALVMVVMVVRVVFFLCWLCWW